MMERGEYKRGQTYTLDKITRHSVFTESLSNVWV